MDPPKGSLESICACLRRLHTFKSQMMLRCRCRISAEIMVKTRGLLRVFHCHSNIAVGVLVVVSTLKPLQQCGGRSALLDKVLKDPVRAQATCCRIHGDLPLRTPPPTAAATRERRFEGLGFRGNTRIHTLPTSFAQTGAVSQCLKSCHISALCQASVHLIRQQTFTQFSQPLRQL